MGYFRIVMGHNALGIESEVAWATLSTFTVKNYPCNEDAIECSGDDEYQMRAMDYVDPSANPATLKRLRRRQLRG